MHKYPLTDTINNLPETVPFVGPETMERNSGHVIEARIGANENVFGPSPYAIEAMKAAASDIWMYGDSESYDLRKALAKFHNVGFENIVIGEGIDGLLSYTCKMFVGAGRHVVTSEGAYPTFNFNVANNGGELHLVPLKNDHEDTIALLEKSREVSAVLTYFSNPNNPMASWHDKSVVSAMIDNIRDGSILVLDEAYVEFAPKDKVLPFDLDNPKILRYRTFSKAYGMAGARIGYCIGEAGLIREMEKVRNHFGMNRAAQIGALAALKDQNYLHEVTAKISAGRERVAQIAAKHGLQALPSATNFVAVDCKRDADFARAIVGSLAKKGVFIRMPAIAPQSRCIRVSIGNDKDLDLFDKALGEALMELA